ncbi:type II toxin-antitoxin system PemK/MazF family toxin [soil metagenome]
MARLSFPRRGEVFLVSFDPTVGSEIRKTRPALVIQNDVANEFSPITIVAAITTKFGPTLRPTEALISSGEGGLTQPSVVLLNQLRSIDRSRMIKKLGVVDPLTLKRVGNCLKISLDLIGL